ncbi:hypothetical protein F511_25063 [Dorcoceras hygrometricum]|uniref:Uncharacterized protein n=1 Tax=Dorcoceras hygrometricum TaxID=472368 RepID=A0A2Z7C6T5_9LAMI|nr:hypothetical protein F511_25063 [Dorcoceras hygrometricum]
MAFSQIINFNSGPDLSYTQSYTSILRLGLPSRDTPDAPITTSGPKNRAARPRPPTYAARSGESPEDSCSAREYFPRIRSRLQESNQHTSLPLWTMRSPGIVESISLKILINTGVISAEISALAHRVSSRESRVSIGGVSPNTLSASSDVICDYRHYEDPSPTHQQSRRPDDPTTRRSRGIRTYSPVPDARRARGPRRGDSSSAELFGYIKWRRLWEFEEEDIRCHQRGLELSVVGRTVTQIVPLRDQQVVLYSSADHLNDIVSFYIYSCDWSLMHKDQQVVLYSSADHSNDTVSLYTKISSEIVTTQILLAEPLGSLAFKMVQVRQLMEKQQVELESADGWRCVYPRPTFSVS